jgi:copper(I)-binding protein
VNRALRAATLGVLLLSPVALTACSAGQVTQTATQDRDKTGGQAQVGGITLRAAELESPRGGSYEAGDDAELRLAIINSGTEADTLVAIDGEGFGGVEVRNTSAGAASSDEIEIPAGSTVYIGEDVTVTLTDLDESLATGQYVELDLSFETAGDITLPVTVANPQESLERGEAFDFHHEEGAEGETAGETAGEQESADGQ